MANLRLRARLARARLSLSLSREKGKGQNPRNSATLAGNDFADVEIAELGVFRAHLVEPHVGHQLLEVKWILSKERHTPLPGVEAECAGDHLLHFSRIPPTRNSVRLHQPAALVERERIPVL